MASTATNTIATNLTDATDASFFTTTPKEFVQCMTFNFKILLFISLIIIFISIFMSCINMALIRTEMDQTISYNEPRFIKCFNKHKCNCLKCAIRRQSIEAFENEKFETHSQYSNYQSVPLLAPYDENKNPTNLFFGQANRYLLTQDGQQSYKLDIFCNLLVLNANIYDKTKDQDIHHQYKAYLVDDNSNKKVLLGELKKDGDGVYKLKFLSDKVNDLLPFNKIYIVYSLDNNEQVLLQGHFKKI